MNPADKPDKLTSPSRSIAAAFWDYFEELHRWQGEYGRRAFAMRWGGWLAAMLLLQFLLSRLSVWLLLFAPLIWASALWTAGCSIAKRLRHLRHAVWWGALLCMVCVLVMAACARAGFSLAAMLLAAPRTLWDNLGNVDDGFVLWGGIGFWTAALALAGFALYIAAARGNGHKRQKG